MVIVSLENVKRHTKNILEKSKQPAKRKKRVAMLPKRNYFLAAAANNQKYTEFFWIYPLCIIDHVRTRRQRDEEHEKKSSRLVCVLHPSLMPYLIHGSTQTRHSVLFSLRFANEKKIHIFFIFFFATLPNIFARYSFRQI